MVGGHRDGGLHARSSRDAPGGWSGDAVHATFAALGYAAIVALPLFASTPLREAVGLGGREFRF